MYFFLGRIVIFCCVHSGIFGERLPLRYYLSVGMLMSGLFTCLFGLGFYWRIHSLAYYAFIQVKTQMYALSSVPQTSDFSNGEKGKCGDQMSSLMLTRRLTCSHIGTRQAGFIAHSTLKRRVCGCTVSAEVQMKEFEVSLQYSDQR